MEVLLTTFHSVQPISYVNRYSSEKKRVIKVRQPCVVPEYNKFMGGTDLMDENVNRHRIAIRSKKWWWAIFSWTLDVSVQNAWHLYNMSHTEKITQLEFKRSIATYYLRRYGISPIQGGRPSYRQQATPGFEELRYDQIGHFVVVNEGRKRRRCVGAYCTSIMSTSCRKCDVGICASCFETYHKRP